MSRWPSPMRALAYAVILVTILGAGAVAQSKRPDPALERLPQGEGRDAVIEFCAGACHSADRLVNARKTSQEWRVTVLQMVSNGAQLFPEDIDTVTKYLSTNLSTSSSAVPHP
jgi:hypothetical protein